MPENAKNDDESSSTDRTLNTFLVLVSAGYAWQIYGWVCGIVVLVTLFILRRIIEIIIFARWVGRSESDFSALEKWTSRARWAVVIFALIGLAISAAEICYGAMCKSIWG